MLTTWLKSFDNFVIIATTSYIFTLSPTGTAIIAITISTTTACGSAISNKVMYKTVRQKYIRYKKQYPKDEQTNISFDIVYGKSSKIF